MSIFCLKRGSEKPKLVGFVNAKSCAKSTQIKSSVKFNSELN